MKALMPWTARLSMMVGMLWLISCAGVTWRTQDGPPPRGHQLIATSQDYTILIAGPQDTLRSLARQYLECVAE